MGTKQVLITGADGHLGMRLARAWLELTDDSVLLWVRASDVNEFQIKKEKLSRQLGEFGPRVGYQWGDLVQEHPFDSIDPQKIRSIIHSAAVTRFNVDEETARKVNIEGTQKILHFAGQCKSLERFGLLSTVYCSGLRSGAIEEVPLDGKDGFANHYERSKWASETELLTQFDYLPWRIFRVATIIADNDTGHVTQYNAFHNTLKLLYYGLLSIIPGKPETPLYFVTGDFVMNAVFDLMNRSPNKSIYHVAHTRAESLTLGELIDFAFEAFMRERDFELRRVLKPLYSDAESFDLLGDAVSTFGGSIVNQAMSSVAPFAKQLFVDKDIHNEKLVSALGNYRVPDARQLVRNTCEYLIGTKWGKYTDGAR